MVVATVTTSLVFIMSGKVARRIRKGLKRVLFLYPERRKHYRFYLKQAKRMYKEGLWRPLLSSV